MAGETLVTVVGNLTADVELRYTNSGIPVAGFKCSKQQAHHVHPMIDQDSA